MHLHDLLLDGSYLAVNGILPLEAILLPSDICDGSILKKCITWFLVISDCEFLLQI